MCFHEIGELRLKEYGDSWGQVGSHAVALATLFLA